MSDSFSKRKRSEIMRAIRSKGTKIETKFANTLRKNKLKFKRNEKRLYGKPDFVFKNTNLALFIDSCFWHGCPYHCRMPKSNKSYWNAKIKNNKLRDKEIVKWYKKHGWKVLRFWEHSLNKDMQKCINKATMVIKNNPKYHFSKTACLPAGRNRKSQTVLLKYLT